MSQSLLQAEVAAMLRKLEWSGHAEGAPAPMYMGEPSMGGGPACPMCGRMQTAGEARLAGFGDEAHGHTPKCKLADLIRRTKEAGWK